MTTYNSRDPRHHRFCSPERWAELRSPRRTRPARTTRKQSLSFAPLPIPRAKIALKHRATITRKNAFLDLNAAIARNACYLRKKELADALGKELNPACKPEDMEFWTERYRAAVAMHKLVFANIPRA